MSWEADAKAIANASAATTHGVSGRWPTPASMSVSAKSATCATAAQPRRRPSHGGAYRSISGDQRTLNAHGAWASVMSPTTEMLTPLLAIQSGTAIMTRPNGRPEENERSDTAAVRHDVITWLRLRKAPGRWPPATLSARRDDAGTCSAASATHRNVYQPACRGATGGASSATRDSCLGSEPDASVQGQYHARLPCRGWRSQRGMRGTRPAHIARSADAAAAVKPPASGGLDRHRHRCDGGAGVPRLSRRLSPAATCSARGSPSVPFSRPVPTRDVSRVGLLARSAERSRPNAEAPPPPALHVFAARSHGPHREGPRGRADRARHGAGRASRAGLSRAQPVRPRADARGRRSRALRIDGHPRVSRDDASESPARSRRRTRACARRHAREALRHPAGAPDRDHHLPETVPPEGALGPGRHGPGQEGDREAPRHPRAAAPRQAVSRGGPLRPRRGLLRAVRRVPAAHGDHAAAHRRRLGGPHARASEREGDEAADVTAHSDRGAPNATARRSGPRAVMTTARTNTVAAVIAIDVA